MFVVIDENLETKLFCLIFVAQFEYNAETK